MAGGRPREIDLNLHDVGDIPLSSDAIRSLFDSALNRFAALSDEEEVITVNSYELDGYVYVDISRHPRNFPPVHQVAGFGQYETPEDASAQRPGDVFLQHLTEKPAYYAHDRISEVPAFLSFKFALKGDKDDSADTAAARFSILAIDDEAVILDLIQAMGQSLGYAVTTAVSGEEGLRKAETQRFDLVLTDLAMPGMSGLEVARELKRRRSDLPIVLVTGWQSSLSDDELRIAGISRVLSKPFRIEQLTDIVQTLASRRNS
jgi:CheY-like chemotaxis protein